MSSGEESRSPLRAEDEVASWNPALRPSAILDETKQDYPEVLSQVDEPKTSSISSSYILASNHIESLNDSEISLQAPEDSMTGDQATEAASHPVEDGAPPTESLSSLEEPVVVSQTSLEASFIEKPDETVGQDAFVGQEMGQDDGSIAPQENYGHQGSSNLLEEATHDSATLPLLDNADPEDGWGGSTETFDLSSGPTGFEALSASAEQESTEKDTVMPPGPLQTSNGGGADIDWGNVEVDGFSFQGSNQVDPEGGEPNDTQKQEDLDALWKAALEDDDEFLGGDGEVDPNGFAFDDDEGFLEETPAPPLHDAQTNSIATVNTGNINSTNSISTNRYAPVGATASSAAPARQLSNSYGIDRPQFTDFSQLDKGATQQSSLARPSYGVYNQPLPYQQSSATSAERAQSFADKSKGGYSSPYDLPMDVSKPRRSRPASQKPMAGAQPAPPPPRSSSINSTTSPQNTNAQLPPEMMNSSQYPPNVRPSAPGQSTQAASSGEFFAELPMVPKARAPSAQSGRYAPSSASAPRPPTGPPPGPTSSLSNQPGPEPVVGQLQAPERLNPFPDMAPVHTQAPSAPPASAPRYSPAPPVATLPTAPPAPVMNSRYSPAPPPAPGSGQKYSPSPSNAPPANFSAPPRSQPQPFAPRTSSPLAYSSVPEQDRNRYMQPQAADSNGSLLQHAVRASSSQSYEAISRSQDSAHSQAVGPPKSATPPPVISGIPSAVLSPTKRAQANYVPQHQPTQGSIPDPVFSPPKRTLSQSPGSSMREPKFAMNALDKPATLNDQFSPPLGSAHQPPSQRLPQRVGFSADVNYVVPLDERASDPLERWKGAPIFNWGLGGTVLTSFPKHVPRYSNAQASPMILCTLGEVKIQSIKDIHPLEDSIKTFPGPLKSKSKKKELLTWMKTYIESLQSPKASIETSLTPDLAKRQQERVILWKVMQIFVEHDGRLEGNDNVVSELRKALGSNKEIQEDSENFKTVSDLSGAVPSISSAIQSDAVDPQAVGELRALLTKGDREKAAWHAVDHRLWAHALLISSTLEKNIWKNVVQEFVRQEVKKMGPDTKALAALYEIFAGNWEESIDELVPPSARAGFQMVSTATSHGQSRNALDGLDHWQETLQLVLSNRSEGDVNALISLGRLLADYGRMEAAHTCFLFARAIVRFSGADDPNSDVVLIGADHKNRPQTLGQESESILLTEVFEFAMSLSGTTASLPHFQPYKLVHALFLAEQGLKNEASQYCDVIAASIKTTSKVSPYINGNFIASLDDLTKRLSQSPKDGTSSWITKPTVEKVSGSLYAKFTSFVAGDDSDAASNISTGEVGPFAKIAGNTPTISPAPSSGDLRGAYSGTVPSSGTPGVPSNSRYAPVSSGSSLVPPEQRSRSKYDPQVAGIPQITPSPDATSPSDLRRSSETSNQPFSPPGNAYGVSQYSPPSSRGQLAPNPYMLGTSVQEPTSFSSSYSSSPFQAKPSGDLSDTEPSKISPVPPTMLPSSPLANLSYQQSSASETNVQPSSYEPPQSSYEPPGYVPYQPEENDDKETPVDKGKKKKSFMDDDDDDDLSQRAAALKKQQKSNGDKEADDAFRKAAEADAARDKDGTAKRGWFGGWWGKKDPSLGPGPIKAKLGEENSFYFDPELKKWVNKNATESQQSSSARATPPPPKGPPSRPSSRASSAMGPPPAPPSTGPPMSRPPTSNPLIGEVGTGSGPPSRSESPALGSTPPTGVPPLAPPLLNGPPSAPPSRPGTSMSNASSIDDLLGAPQARKGGSVKKPKRGGRYVDVMNQK